MLSYRVLLGLLPVGLLLAACASNNSDQAQQIVPGDSSGKPSVFTDGFIALQHGDNATARQKLQLAYNASPHDVYDEENLAAAYQNTGDLAQALPLYRDTLANGQDLHPQFVTQPELTGMTMAEIARRNLKLAGVDEYGNALQPMQAAALQAPQQKYEIYFRFDSVAVTPEAAAVISAAAKSAMAGNLTRIAVVGHTDTVGSAAYNQRLSEQRAAAVTRVLVADGVPAATIVASGVGKADLAVPTPDGVREPRNRRVEISAEEARIN